MTDDTAYLAETRAPMLYGVTFCLLGVAILVFCLRLYCRIFMIKAIQVSDYLMAIATAITIGMCAMIHLQIKTGMGRHVEYSRARPEMWSLSMKVGYVQNILYQSSLGSKTTSAILQCIPISAAFNITTFPKGCWNMMAMNFFTSSVNAATDIIILILPIPILIKMKLQGKKKVVLFLILSTGIISVVSALVRLSNIVLWNDAADSTYNGSVIPMWDAVEVTIGITSASVPALQPLFRWSAERVLSQASSARVRTKARADIRLDSISQDIRPVMWQQALGSIGTFSKAGTSLEEGLTGEGDQAPLCK